MNFNPYPTTIEILSQLLIDLNRNLNKSISCYENGLISKETHELHKANINKHKTKYQNDLNKLLEQ